MHLDSLRNDNNKLHTQLFSSVLTSSLPTPNEETSPPDKITTTNSIQPIPINIGFSSKILSTENVTNNSNHERTEQFSDTPSVDFQSIDSSSSISPHMQSTASIASHLQSEETKFSHSPSPSTTFIHNDLHTSFNSSSPSSHRRWIPTRPSHLGSLDTWKEYIHKYSITHDKLSKTSQKVMYLKRGTTGIAGQMIGVCDSLLIAMMTNRGLQCRLS